MTHAVFPGAEVSAVDAILRLVRERTGLDFSGYRRNTIRRRVANRTTALGVASLDEYAAFLAASATEAERLAERLTIKVSRFYRDRDAFDLLRERLLPALAARGRPLRVWSAGCSRGEEAYTLAMLLEAAGVAGRVVASDIDADALAAAAEARYGDESVVDLPADLADRFLDRAASGSWTVRRTVRERVRFERRDIVLSRPPLRFDLVCCRNVLIYLDRATQARTLEGLESALAPCGYLLLGQAEWPVSLSPWTVVSKRLRAFQAPEDLRA